MNNDYERYDFWFRETVKVKQNMESDAKPSSQKFSEQVATEIVDSNKKYMDHILKNI